MRRHPILCPASALSAHGSHGSANERELGMWIKREGKSRLLSIASKEWDFPPQPSGRAWCCSLSPDLEPLPIVLLPSREPAVEGTGRLEMRRHVMPQQPPNGKGGLYLHTNSSH
jgi:hypothetical protein